MDNIPIFPLAIVCVFLFGLATYTTSGHTDQKKAKLYNALFYIFFILTLVSMGFAFMYIDSYLFWEMVLGSY